MTVYKRANGKWCFRKRVRLASGLRARVFGMPAEFGLPNTKVGAEEAMRRKVTQVIEGRQPPAPPPPKATCPTVKAFEEVYLQNSEAKNASSTVDSKKQILRDHVMPAMGHLPLDRVTFAVIEDLKHALLAKGLKKKTVNNVLTVLRRMLALAAKRGLINGVPEIEWLKVDRQDFDFFSFDEADRLLERAAPDGEWHPMVMVALRCGLRLSELLGLRWEDVDLVAGRLFVRQAIVRGVVKPPKNGKAREIPLGDEVSAALQAQRHLRGDYVFCNADGRPLTKAYCKRPLWRIAARAQLRRIGWHVLRHTFASHLAMRGVPLKVIQELMGHATIQMTMRYAHLSPEVSRDAVRLLDRKADAAGRKAK